MATVAVAYLHPGEVSHSFHESMLHMLVHDLAHRQHVGPVIAQDCGVARIADGRNSAVRKFLTTAADWLLFIDADMGFEPDALDRLMDVADPQQRPIVGGLCFAQNKGPTTSAGARHYQSVPTIYRWHATETSAGTYPVHDYPRDALVECDATGGAFFLAHRSVFAKLAEEYEPPREWFNELILQGLVFGEDIGFFLRCRRAGLPVFVHTGVRTSHYKRTYLDETSYVPPSDAPTFVVIPMKNRIDLTRSLVDQLAEQGGYEAIFVMDNGSKPKARNQLQSIHGKGGVEVFDADGMNIHEMWNLGIDEAVRRAWPCNVAILNNDIKVGPRFLPGLAEALRTEPLVGVVCPNYDGREGSGLEFVEGICAGRYDGTGGLAGFAFMIKGESDYRFPEELQWWCGDNDMLLHVLLAGAKAAIVHDVTCEHVGGGGQTGDWDDPEMRKILDQDREWFHRKWWPAGEDVA